MLPDVGLEKERRHAKERERDVSGKMVATNIARGRRRISSAAAPTEQTKENEVRPQQMSSTTRTNKVSAPATPKAGHANAFGCTFVLAPTFSMRMAAEDALLLKAFAKYDLAILLRSEVQPTARLVELIEVESRNGIGPADALCASDLLGADANRILSVPNAGGASRVSEAMSAEVLARSFGARLLQTEMEIVYWPSNGSITDFSIELGGIALGVSVTRAMGAPGSEYSLEMAQLLLKKKLNGILRSTESSCGAWEKQILHIWAPTTVHTDVIGAAYNSLESTTTANTIVIVTVCEGLGALFNEKASTPPKPVVRLAKGAKDETHLRVLALSDPMIQNSKNHQGRR